VYKTPDERRRKGTRWRVWYRGADGRRRWSTGFVDKSQSEALARRLEDEQRAIAAGLVDPAVERRRAESLRPVADHLADYRGALVARGDTAKHAAHVASAAGRLLEDARAATLGDLAVDRLSEALGRLRARRSARTANHALAAVKAFLAWAVGGGRLAVVPAGIAALRPYNEKVDRRRVRRALSAAEIDRLLAAAEAGRPIHGWPRKSRHLAVAIPGPDRAALYRVAMGTGFRDRELRSLTPESFRLDGAEPCVVVAAAYSKRRRDDAQPIRRDLAAWLSGWLSGKPAGEPVFALPWSAVRMLRVDLAAAGIPERDARGRVVDFHALRHSYITALVRSGVNPKTVQRLARHSTITLTLDRYCDLPDEDARRAIEVDRP
jgi:integrase